jgi:hypothetical protein
LLKTTIALKDWFCVLAATFSVANETGTHWGGGNRLSEAQ